MKIRTAADVERLDARIKNELGIDIQKYRSPEVVKNILALILFPQYLITWTIRPILFALGLFLLGFAILNLEGKTYLIYGIVGFCLFISTGALLGLNLFVRKMKKDMFSVMEFSFNLMGKAMIDLNAVKQEITAENKREVFGLLFNGIIHIITIPLVTKGITDEIKFIGKWLASAVKWILMWMADQFEYKDKLVAQELERKEQDLSATDYYEAMLEGSINTIKKVSNFTFIILQTPFIIGFISSLMTLLIFLLLINQSW